MSIDQLREILRILRNIICLWSGKFEAFFSLEKCHCMLKKGYRKKNRNNDAFQQYTTMISFNT